jgi:hypothetical protein
VRTSISEPAPAAPASRPGARSSDVPALISTEPPANHPSALATDPPPIQRSQRRAAARLGLAIALAFIALATALGLLFTSVVFGYPSGGLA